MKKSKLNLPHLHGVPIGLRIEENQVLWSGEAVDASPKEPNNLTILLKNRIIDARNYFPSIE